MEPEAPVKLPAGQRGRERRNADDGSHGAEVRRRKNRAYAVPQIFLAGSRDT
jgi:hypothetical protein